MAKQSNQKKQNILKKCVKAPFRALIKARDCYIKGMLGFMGKFGNPTAGAHTLPKRYSTSSYMANDDEEYIRELKRVAAIKSLKDKLELEILRAQVMGPRATRDGDVAVRKSGVTFARIDENAPCDFVDDAKVNIDLVAKRRNHVKEFY